VRERQCPSQSFVSPGLLTLFRESPSTSAYRLLKSLQKSFRPLQTLNREPLFQLNVTFIQTATGDQTNLAKLPTLLAYNSRFVKNRLSPQEKYPLKNPLRRTHRGSPSRFRALLPRKSSPSLKNAPTRELL